MSEKLPIGEFFRYLFSKKNQQQVVDRKDFTEEIMQRAEATVARLGIVDYIPRPLPEFSSAAIASNEQNKPETTAPETVEQLHEKIRLQSEFIANMSNELRTPLNSIIGFSDLMLMGVDGQLTEDQRDDLNKINSSGRQLLALINDLLDIAKLDSGRMDLARDIVNLPHLIEDISKTWEGLTRDKPVTISLVKDAEIPHVYADAFRLRQVLYNLVSNAVRYTPQGEVTVRYGKQSENEVYIKVQDTGVGIPKDYLPSVFSRFSRVDKSTSRHGIGTGLGLTISQELVEQHGGEIYVESEVGVGTTFSVILPAADTQSTTQDKSD